MRPTIHRFLLVILLAAAAAGTAAGCGGSSTATSGTASASPSPARMADPETLYQVSTLSALIDGLYQPATTVGALKGQGDTGIGTFAALDGEMVILDDVVYQVLSDGSVTKPADAVGSPFAAVTTFAADKTVSLANVADYVALQKRLDAELSGVNHIYAVRIEGHFDAVRTRSVPKQSEPYTPLLEVTAKQPEFEFKDVDGVLVGFWCPAWVGQINVPGYHLHFLTADHSGGGHVLEVSVASATAELDETPVFDLTLPDTAEFRAIDLAGDYDAQMRAAEE
jgi:acetolactate decarboxylase